MTDTTLRLLALFFLTLALAEVFFLSALVPVDAAFANWVGVHRSCTLEHTSALLQERPLLSLVTLGVCALVGLCVHGQWSDARHLLLTVIMGGFLSELLKTGFERARPSVLPPLVGGNSFPSGHVVGALLIAGVLGVLVTRQRWTAWVKLVVLCVIAGHVSLVIWQRVYLGRHWLSDILGSLLLVSAWLCFVLPRPALLGFSRQFGLTCLALLIGYQIFYFFPASRFILPSATAAASRPAFSFSFGEPTTRDLLNGAWGEQSQEPAGPITWMQHGEASIAVQLVEPHAYTLKFAVRPFAPSTAFACVSLEVKVNQQPAGSLLLYRGWREYRLQLNPAWLVPGRNVVTFRVDARLPDPTADQRTVAFRYMRFFSEQR